MSREVSAREKKMKSLPTAQTRREGTAAAAEDSKPRLCKDFGSTGFRFDDPYWDDAFDSWHNPTLRTCCRWC